MFETETSMEHIVYKVQVNTHKANLVFFSRRYHCE